MLDPFRHVGDYGQPRAKLLPIGNRRYAARMILLALGIAAVLLGGTYGVANAATTPQPSVHALMGAIKSGATMTIDGITYRATVVHQRPAVPVIRYAMTQPLCRTT